MKRLLVGGMISIFIGIAIFWILSRPAPEIVPTKQALTYTPQPLDLPWPSKGQAAIGSSSFGIVSETPSQKPVPIASTAKVLTALAVLQKRPLKLGENGPLVPITADDVAAYQRAVANGESFLPVAQGEALTEYQALQALLLPSANNIASTLTNWAFGSQDNYLNYANQVAAKEGLTTTHIADASGFSPQTVSTAHDLVLLGNLAMKDQVIQQIVSQTEINLPLAGVVKNVNRLLGKDGISGIKTGNTAEAGGCFIFSTIKKAGDHNEILIGAVADAPDLSTAFSDSQTLLAAASPHLRNVEVVKTGQIVADYIAPWGATAQAVAKQNATLLTWDNLPIKESHNVTSVSVSQKQDEQVGSITLETRHVRTTVPIVLEKPLKPPSLKWSLFHFAKN